MPGILPDMTSVTVTPADLDQKPAIANLIQLYLYDMTEFMPFPLGADGRFDYGFLDRFWRYPYLIHSGDELAGFALVIDECPLTATTPCWFMAEFFVLKAYRRAGMGSRAVSDIVERHPGRWHIGAPCANLPAQAFWTKALAPRSPTLSDITFDGDNWRLRAFRF
jgi:predicted acetyltransferase